MTERKIENRIRKLHELESRIAELNQEADAIREEIKAEMTQQGIDELKTKNHVIRWKEVITERLDSKALKQALPEIYKQFIRPSTSRRFTVV